MNTSLLMLVIKLRKNSSELLEIANGKLMEPVENIFNSRFFILDEIKKNIEEHPEELTEINDFISEQVVMENIIVEVLKKRQSKITEKLLDLNKSAKAQMLYKDY